MNETELWENEFNRFWVDHTSACDDHAYEVAKKAFRFAYELADLDGRNIGAELAAQKLQKVAERGERSGWYANTHMEACVAAILKLHSIKDQLTQALEAIVTTIENTGGIANSSDVFPHPVADPEWTDLGEAYLMACEALGKNHCIMMN